MERERRTNSHSRRENECYERGGREGEINRNVENIVDTVSSESIHTPRLFPHVVVLQPEFKILKCLGIQPLC